MAYQILVMFMLAGAYAIGAICVVWLAGRRLFSSEPRFKKEILKN
ncbi:ABC transporter permease [Thermodesulfatator indicus]